MTFRFAAEKIHLTYKTHIPLDDFKNNIASKCPPLKILSFVHENGDSDEKDPTPYKHTHIFMWFKKRLDTTDARFFDLEKIHPHISKGRGLTWSKTICTAYHHGHKTKSDGKKYHIPPVLLHQEGVENYDWDLDVYNIINKATGLQDACLKLDLVPRSISDVNTMMRSGSKRTFESLDRGLDRDMFIKLDPWPLDDFGKPLAVIVRGPAGIGKTQFCLAQFEKCFKIEDLDELKDMPPDTECIIFDECLFDRCSKKTMVSLLDWGQPRTIRTRNVNARIPAEMYKIFNCNEHEHPFGSDPAVGGHASVTRRFRLMDVAQSDLTVPQ